MTDLSPGAGEPTARDAELARRLAVVRARVGKACAAVGRDPAQVCLIVVTKHFPPADVVSLWGLGVTDVGENRDQEASAKVAALPPQARAGLRVHFVGQLQTNKAASAAAYADVVHSVDRARLATALDHGAERVGRRLGALVQVSLDRPDGRGGRAGVAPADVPALADLVAAQPSLDLLGVMAVAPLGADPAAAFAQLASVADRLRSDHPGAGWISAGMSADLEAALAHGATHLRVGSAILGSRPPFG